MLPCFVNYNFSFKSSIYIEWFSNRNFYCRITFTTTEFCYLVSALGDFNALMTESIRRSDTRGAVPAFYRMCWWVLGLDSILEIHDFYFKILITMKVPNNNAPLSVSDWREGHDYCMIIAWLLLDGEYNSYNFNCYFESHHPISHIWMSREAVFYP